MEPKYSLPKCEEYPIENEKKFLRNTLNIDDIIGVKPKKYISNKFLRDSINKDDLKDSSPKKSYIRNDKYNNMDYKDVYKKNNKNTRNTNPLMPIYILFYIIILKLIEIYTKNKEYQREKRYERRHECFRKE